MCLVGKIIYSNVFIHLFKKRLYLKNIIILKILVFFYVQFT